MVNTFVCLSISFNYFFKIFYAALWLIFNKYAWKNDIIFNTFSFIALMEDSY